MALTCWEMISCPLEDARDAERRKSLQVETRKRIVNERVMFCGRDTASCEVDRVLPAVI